MKNEMRYGFCTHGTIHIEDMAFHCDDCVRDEVFEKVARLLNTFSVAAPIASYTGTFTPEQFMSVLKEPPVEEQSTF